MVFDKGSNGKARRQQATKRTMRIELKRRRAHGGRQMVVS